MKIKIAFYALPLVALILGASTASAKPVTLACGPTSDNRVGHGFIHFDESEGTASFATDANYNGSSPASFTSTDIQWKFVINNSVEYEQIWYVLNRLTGELNVTTDIHGDSLSPHHNKYYCSVVQAQF
jgi:hypothetical protein